MGNLDKESLEHRVLRLELSIQQLQEQLGAEGLALSWLMAHVCSDEARRFLAAQANELEPSAKFPEEVAQLDALREDLEQWCAQRKDSTAAQG